MRPTRILLLFFCCVLMVSIYMLVTTHASHEAPKTTTTTTTEQESTEKIAPATSWWESTWNSVKDFGNQIKGNLRLFDWFGSAPQTTASKTETTTTETTTGRGGKTSEKKVQEL